MTGVFCCQEIAVSFPPLHFLTAGLLYFMVCHEKGLHSLFAGDKVSSSSAEFLDCVMASLSCSLPLTAISTVTFSSESKYVEFAWTIR